MDLNLKDKVAVVSGASKGIGLAIVTTLAREGVRVIACSRRRSKTASGRLISSASNAEGRNMNRLEDKVAIVTGATSGIGRSCAVRFAQEGAHVVVVGRRDEAGEAIAASLGDYSLFVRADVSCEEGRPSA